MIKQLILIRHGETEWSKSGQHTSTTDLPLTEKGEAAASALADRLAEYGIQSAFSSPRKRAKDTAALALPAVPAETLDDLAEWNYGEYEGLTTTEIRHKRPHWNLWTDGCPGGESPAEVFQRTKRLIDLTDSLEGVVGFFAHGHILRALAVNWLDLDPPSGERMLLDTGSISLLEPGREQRSLRRWNL
jgi:broad specificity phosphatase PhoE